MYPITPLAIISTPSRNLEEKEDLSLKYGDWQLPFNAPKKYCSSDSGYNSQAAFGTVETDPCIHTQAWPRIHNASDIPLRHHATRFATCRTSGLGWKGHAINSAGEMGLDWTVRMRLGRTAAEGWYPISHLLPLVMPCSSVRRSLNRKFVYIVSMQISIGL